MRRGPENCWEPVLREPPNGRGPVAVGKQKKEEKRERKKERKKREKRGEAKMGRETEKSEYKQREYSWES